MTLSSRAAADLRVALAPGSCPRLLARWLHQARNVSPSVVHPQQEWPQRRVADHAERAGINLNPLVHVKVQTQAIGEDGLDHITVRADRVHRVLAEPLVPVPHRLDGPVLHVQHGLAVVTGEADRAGVSLHDAPQRLLRQPPQRLARPVPVPALPYPLLLLDRTRLFLLPARDCRRGLAAAFQRAADDRIQPDGPDPSRENGRLRAAAGIE